MSPPRHLSESWSNPPTPINRYRPLGGAYVSLPDLQTSASQPVPQPSFRNKNRKRGVVLTQQGWQKLMQAGVLYDDFGRRYTHEELSERSLLDARTVSRVIGCEVKVDKRTLTTFFRAFDLPLELGDYTTPSAKEGEQEEDTSESGVAPSSGADIVTEELMHLRQRLMEECDRLSSFLDSPGAGNK